MYLESLTKFNKLTIKEFDTSIFEEPQSNEKLKLFIKESQMALQYTPCEEYLDLLKMSDGLEWNGCSFYNAEDFIYENIENRKLKPEYRKFIVFGSSGNVETYTYNNEDKTYNIANMFGLDDKPFETFNSFADLVIGVLKSNDQEMFNKVS